MYRGWLAATWAVCLLATAATAWLGSTSGLFGLAEVGTGGVVATLAPYPAIALLAWVARRRPVSQAVALVLAVVVSGYGLFLFYNQWYWPQPTNPDPWRPWIVPVIVVPQWAAVGLGGAIMVALHFWSTRRKAIAAEPVAAPDRGGTSH
jgi:hypothetical protein